MDEIDFRLADGRVLHGYDSAPGATDRLAVVWHHGTPNLGTPPAPLAAASERLGIRWISFDRPGYGGSTAAPGRTVADVATDLTAVLDTLGIGSFAQLGYSGGGTYALGATALLGNRTTAVATLAAIAPYPTTTAHSTHSPGTAHSADTSASTAAAGLDWYGGMIASGVASLRAAAAGRDARMRNEEIEYDPEFTETDLAMFGGAWGWLGSVAGDKAMPNGPDGAVDDDCSYVLPWGCDPAAITAPTLLLHGTADRIIPCSHARWLAATIPTATLATHENLSHITILNQADQALHWLHTHST
ncbi:pimeloyl-ACP methyl ester carboxylesterase [Kribbella aluminosa]|uniref:Pimeloyl-ACP methyl ester carboxylesterase n=1 Tax=Kribbella aluminosa TaxID=416017 RepID=A0ABS4UU63_9ACTN|nr:alpha/beta hydrolase [Kribbella aluminosa]MBP2355184.1 pimeloyl-ACP methyl ester carboxylesterase [Kribbella aluminosa]